MEVTGVDLTTMAIRETLMSYFKGSCVEYLTTNSNVRLTRISSGGLNFNYERREQDIAQISLLTVGGLPIAKVQHAPQKITFYKAPLTRSPQLKELYTNLRKFMDEYLPGVESTYTKQVRIYGA